jgi:hypothetical protein
MTGPRRAHACMHAHTLSVNTPMHVKCQHDHVLDGGMVRDKKKRL